MGSLSTATISRSKAIRRILAVVKTIKKRDFPTLNSTGEWISFEEFHRDFFVHRANHSSYNCPNFPNVIADGDSRLHEFSNEALGDYLEFPFIRFSISENYEVIDD